MQKRTWLVSAALAAVLAVWMAAGCRREPAAGPQVAPAGEAPAFTLSDAAGRQHSLADYRGKWVVLEWINYGCPFVQKHYNSGNMQRLQQTYTARDVVWLSVCSSAPGQQGHMTPAEWVQATQTRQAHPTAVLLDADGQVGRAYGATRTPEMVVIDPQGRVVYRGAIDDKPTTDVADVAGATNYVSQVLDAVLAGQPAPLQQTAPYGCTVKYAQ